MHTNTFCKYRKKLLASPRVHLVLDASKAFDKIHHYTLIRKLLDRKTPIMLVRILLFWHTLTIFTYLTRLDKEKSYLQICNLYVDDLSWMSNRKCMC